MTKPRVAQRFQPFGTTIFAEMTRLASEHRAVNLSQGFPDFDGPEFVKRAAAEAMTAGHNQYARMQGVPELNRAVETWWRRGGGRPLDPDAEVTVTSGCTEALAACMLGFCDPGDEVVLFEPFYDSYRACVSMAGATPRFVTLRDSGGRFVFDEADLRGAVTERTRAIVLNSPHNPTGKVYSEPELRSIAAVAIEHDLLVVADEVYERLVFRPELPHVSIASLPGMADRTVVCSSLGKTFSLTGWKIGWAIAPPHLTAGVRAAHQFLTFAIATPLQFGAAAALAGEETEPYLESLLADYTRRRAFLCGELGRLGFDVIEPDGTYFVMADHRRVSERLGVSGDVELCRWLTEHAGVATIPPSVFFSDPAAGAHLLRFAFCKRPETLEAAAERLRAALA